MLFNSFEYLLFFITVFILYWFVTDKNLKLQNILLIIAGYTFYGWWNVKFLILLAFSTLLDYYVGIRIYQTPDKRMKKIWLFGSIAVNIALLGFFKYYNFFAQSWMDAWASLGYHMHPWTLKIILPVGISFYTFQSMSYALDIYKGKLEPTKDLITYAAFVSFFPQLVAGPIERAAHLLPQLQEKRKFDYQRGVTGLQLILWGLFKKVAIADSLAKTVNEIFANYSQYSTPTRIIGAVYFAFQIYCDFSGYTDIARGSAKLMGVELMKNFSFPYFSRNIAEFWKRWHISLSTWFRDYVYIPLGGSRVNKGKAIRNVFITFLVSGLWHGANWTFIVWGAIHALFFIPSFITGTNKKYQSGISPGILPSLPELSNIILTFSLATFAWIFFRADSLHHAIHYIFDFNFSAPIIHRTPIPYLILFIAFEWILYKNLFEGLKRIVVVRYSTYLALIFALLYFLKVNSTENQFIYFQF